MYQDSTQYGSTLYDLRFLYDKEPAVSVDNQPLWCVEKQRIIPEFVKSGVSIGTIRSPKCNQVTTSKKYMCTACETVPQIGALRLQVLRGAKFDFSKTKTKDKSITKAQQLARLRNLRIKYRLRGNEIRRLKVRLARNSAKLKKVTDIGSEHALRGDTKGLSKTLKIAYDRGLLSDKKNTLSFLQNMIENINRKAKGKRYSSFTKSLYLFICYLYVEIFCSFNLSLYDRVKNASTVVNFLRIWRAWIFRTKSKSLKTNFITRQCYNHVLLSCHAAVLHIKAARDFSPQTEIQLPKTGSDCCEDFFSQNGSWIRNHHNYSYADMVDMLPKMNRLNEIRASKDGPVIPKGHKKQMNIWDKGNPRTGNAPDLSDYPTDDAFSAAWTEGITCAQNICSEVGMVPDGEPENDAEKLSKQFAWYYLPHLTDKEAEMLASMVDEDNEEENAEEDDAGNDDVIDETDVAAVNEVQMQLNDDENDDEGDDQIAGNEARVDGDKFSPKVKIPGEEKYIYKSTLVALLNSCPDGKLSKDRLVRVQSGGKNMPSSIPADVMNYRNDIGIHADVSVLKKENGKYVSIFGRVQRIIKKSGRRGNIEYRKPVSLNEKENNINIRFLLTNYVSINDSTFVFTPGKTFIAPIQDILMGCELAIDDNDNYILNSDDNSAIANILSDLNNSKKRKAKPIKTKQSVSSQKQTPTEVKEVELMADGTVCVEIEATTSKSGRLQRKRRVVLGDG